MRTVGGCVRATTNLSIYRPNPTLPAFNQIGGYEQLAAAYARAIPSRTIANTTCHVPRADAMHMFRDPHTADLPWTGMTFGLTIMATWYWCTDQVSVNIIACYPLGFQGGLWRVWVAHAPICGVAWAHLHSESGLGWRLWTTWPQAWGQGARVPCGPGELGLSV